MKKKYIICFLISFFALPLFSREASALRAFTGEAVRIDKGDIYLKKHKGRVYKFKVGTETTYYPKRMPKKGEWVRVTYEDKKGFFSRKISHIAHTVIIYRFTPDKAVSGELTVNMSSANLRAGPRKDYARLGVVSSGETLIVRGLTGNWYKVALPEQNLLTGWVHSSVVRVDSTTEPSSHLPATSLPRTRSLSDYVQPLKPHSF